MTLPKSCEVEALAEWQSEIWDANSSGPALAADLALGAAIRALLEAKVREAVQATRNDASASCECDGSGLGSAYVDWDSADDTIVSRVLGAK